MSMAMTEGSYNVTIPTGRLSLLTSCQKSVCVGQRKTVKCRAVRCESIRLGILYDYAQLKIEIWSMQKY